MTELPRKNISLLIPLLGISVSFVLLWLADMRSHRESLVWGEMGWGLPQCRWPRQGHSQGLGSGAFASSTDGAVWLATVVSSDLDPESESRCGLCVVILLFRC